MKRMSWLIPFGLIFLCSARESFGADEIEGDRATPSSTAAQEWDREERSFADQLSESRSRLLTLTEGDEARRLTLDVLMLASVSGDIVTTNRMKQDLVLRYPESVEAAYILQSFPDVNALRSFIDQQLLKDLTTAEQAARVLNAIRPVFQQQSKGLLSDQRFALRLARVSFLADDRSIGNPCRAALKDATQRVAGIACDELNSTVERFQELQQLLFQRDCLTFQVEIRGFQSDLFQRMTPDEQALPEIRRILARNHLAADELEAALPHYEILTSICSDAQFVFQHGFCLARMHRFDDARSKFQRLLAEYPDSEWAHLAEAVMTFMGDFDDVAEQHAQWLILVINAYREVNIELCDFELCWSAKNGTETLISLSADIPRNFIELIARRDTETLLALKCQSHESTVYLRSEPAIYRLPKISIFPQPQISDLHVDKAGHFHGKAQLQTSNSLEGLQKALKDLLKSESIGSESAMRHAMTGLLRKGQFPRPLITESGKRTLQYGTANLDEPRWQTCSLTFSDRSKLISARFESIDDAFEVRRFNLGSRKDFHLVSGTWPSLPTKVLAENDFASLMRLMGAAVQLFSADSQTQTASERTSSQR